MWLCKLREKTWNEIRHREAWATVSPSGGESSRTKAVAHPLKRSLIEHLTLQQLRVLK